MADHPNTHKQPSQVSPAPGTESTVPSPRPAGKSRESDQSATVLRGAEEQVSNSEILASNE